MKCGIVHNGAYYIDSHLVFGAVNGTMIFQRISDAIRYMLAQDGIEVWNYIDDTFAAIEEVGATEKFEKLCNLITELGLPLNPDKVQPPSETMEVMGIVIDVSTKTLSIPHTKMRDIEETVNSFIHKSYMCKRDLQSLLGRLLYVSKVIKPARGFLNQMLQTLRNMTGVNRAKIDNDFRRDLNWFKQFLQSFNGKTSFANWQGPSDVTVYVNASLSGLGAVCKGQFYSVWLSESILKFDGIVIYEMINVLVCLRMWGMDGVIKG